MIIVRRSVGGLVQDLACPRHQGWIGPFLHCLLQKQLGERLVDEDPLHLHARFGEEFRHQSPRPPQIEVAARQRLANPPPSLARGPRHRAAIIREAKHGRKVGKRIPVPIHSIEENVHIPSALVRTVHARVSPTAQRHISDIGHASRGGLLDLREGAPQPDHEFLNGEAAAARTPVGMDLVAISFDRQGDRAQERPMSVGTPGQAAPIGSSEDPHAARERGQSREGKLNRLQAWQSVSPLPS